MAPGEGSPAHRPHGERGSTGWGLTRGLYRAWAGRRRGPFSQPPWPGQHKEARRTVPTASALRTAAPPRLGTSRAPTQRPRRERPQAGPMRTAVGAARRGGAPNQLAAPASRKLAAPATKWRPSTCRRRDEHARFPTGGECKKLAACPRGQLGQEARG